MRNPDGLRTTYAFLATAIVRRGERVEQGQPLGTAAGPVHFGVRAGDEYLDPTDLLFGPPRVHLVPDDARQPQSEAGERRGLVHFLAGAIRVSKDAAVWVGTTAAEVGVDLAAEHLRALRAKVDSIVLTAELADRYLHLPLELLVATARMRAYLSGQKGCTPADREPPARAGRHIAILVAGFGSDGHDDAIAGLDTRALGYADSDVAQFSYAGGQVAGPRRLPGIPTTDGYRAADADGPIRESADRLRELVDRVAAANPGVPIDLIGHSLGGLVARAALDDRDAGGAVEGPVANLVTIGTPHSGADIATGSAWLQSSSTGLVVVAGTALVTGEELLSPAAEEMREGSAFLRGLAGEPVAAGRFTSIASAGDLTVTANHSLVAGAVNVLVPGGPGREVHDALPASASVRREVALALAGLGPTCRSLWRSMAQVLTESYIEDAAAGTAGFAGLLADRWISRTTALQPERGTGPG